MEDKRVWLLLFVALFGGNITGITGILGNHAIREGHEEIQRQIDDIKQNDLECRATLSSHHEEFNDHLEFEHEVRANTTGTLQRHEAQIQELYRNYMK